MPHGWLIELCAIAFRGHSGWSPDTGLVGLRPHPAASWLCTFAQLTQAP